MGRLRSRRLVLLGIVETHSLIRRVRYGSGVISSNLGWVVTFTCTCYVQYCITFNRVVLKDFCIYASKDQNGFRSKAFLLGCIITFPTYIIHIHISVQPVNLSHCSMVSASIPWIGLCPFERAFWADSFGILGLWQGLLWQLPRYNATGLVS